MSLLSNSRNKIEHPLVGASEEDITALFEKFSSSYIDLSCCFHEMDNSFIDMAFGKTVSNLNEKSFSFHGVCLAPYSHNGQNYAVIFLEPEYGSSRWCHVSERIVNMWKEQAKSHGHA